MKRMWQHCQGIAALIVLLSAGSVSAEWHQRTEGVMGTRVHVEFWNPDVTAAQDLLEHIFLEMHRIDHTYSPYKEQSELSALNREAPTGWVRVSDELFHLLRRAQEVSELSEGAFDITYASVGRYYDYRKGERPSPEQQRALEAIDYRHLQYATNPSRVRFNHPAVYVDLGGIAKGYAVDRAMAMLERAGVRQASVSAGGDSRILGDRRGKPWRVGIRDPRKEGQYRAVLPLVNTAVSTSGDYERFFEEDGVRYHHILDPKTGDSARDSISVTILGPQATLTDALSTTVFVLGPKKGIELINQIDGFDAIVITPGGELLYSAELESL